MVTSPRIAVARSQMAARPLAATPSSPAASVTWEALHLPPSKLFGTDGIRGKADELLTAPLALQVGYWAGQVLQAQAQQSAPVLIGQDSRNSSPRLAAAIATGLTAAGVDVWDLGLCPTPCVASLAQQLGAAGGVMISASHNPPEDNGIKFFSGTGCKLAPELQRQIEADLRQHTTRPPTLGRSGHYVNHSDLVSDYVVSLHDSLKGTDLSGLRIVLDLAWGAATRVAVQAFTQAGAEVICLHDSPDGDRINVNCGSTHLGLLQAAVAHHQADLGFAFDGDADRVMAVDAQGRVVDGDYILYFWGTHLQAQAQLPNNLIISTVMANLGFERAWQQRGGHLVRTDVGDQHVHAAMQQQGAVLGGEQSGHILCHHHSITGDGVLTALHLASLVKGSGVSLAELVDQSFKTYPQLLRNVRVTDRDRRLNWQDCTPLQTAIQRAEADMGDRGRVLVRASGTEPVIRVMVEAECSDLAEQWTAALVDTVQLHLA